MSTETKTIEQFESQERIELPELPAYIGALKAEIERLRSGDVAAAIAHRACCGTEHDPEKGRLHGCCVVCGVPWPCDTAKYFLRKPA